MALIVATKISCSQTLLILGDSLSAGYQMPLEKSWPALLDAALPEITVINASVSGDTVANGLDRLPRLLEQHQPEFILIELGGNDGLRGANVNDVKTALSELIELSQQSGANTLLMQIEIPPQMGNRYRQLFAGIYPELSKSYDVPLLPFFMLPIYLDESLMREDKIHPNEAAQPIIAKYMQEQLVPYLDKN